MFQDWLGIPGINTQVFLSRHGNEASFSYFSTFQSLDYRISENIEANPCGFNCDNKKGPLNKYTKFH